MPCNPSAQPHLQISSHPVKILPVRHFDPIFKNEFRFQQTVNRRIPKLTPKHKIISVYQKDFNRSKHSWSNPVANQLTILPPAD